MNRRIQRILCTATILIAVFACQKDDDAQPIEAACRLQKETIDSDYYLLYTYDEDRNPTKIERYNPYYMTNILEVFDGKIASTEANKLHPITITTQYDVGFFSTLPNVSRLAVTMDGVTQVNWRTFFFQYDSKGRLVQVALETPNIQGDDEWELLVSYNDQDNVTELKYQFTTGPRHVHTIVVVDGHDNHPTPYAGVKAYKFILNAWDNSPGPLISALSKNNPTSFRLFVEDVQTMKFDMTYEYNEHGFPLDRATTNTNDAGQYTYHQTYEYVCP